MQTSSLKKLSLSFALALATVLSACGPQQGVSKEQVDSLMAARQAQALEDEHVEASGFKFVHNGSDLYAYQDGQPVNTLFLVKGQTYPIEVLFLDLNGAVIDFSVHTPGEFTASVVSSDATKLSWTSTGYFTGNLTAHQRGKANLTVALMHDGHADYDATFAFDVRLTN